ncbi:MAG: DUF5615 family PIN-like protein [Pseudomonadota bacterium]
MRLLIDENVSVSVARALTDAGHDVDLVATLSRSADDESVMEMAIAADRVLVTFDSDFGRLIFADRKHGPRAVIYLRSPPPSPDETVRRILRVLAVDAPSIDGFFVSVDKTARFHPLPYGSHHG